MLYAKISPAAQVVTQDGPFNTTVQTADLVTATAQDYTMGISKMNFILTFGSPVYDKDEKLLGIKPLVGDTLTLTKEELADWGTDDSYILNLAAQKKNFTILEFIKVEIDQFGKVIQVS